ncbi:hypothetical protein GGR57DRAFT_445678 [Xylariaceae sp. FL1272]|nr:hypothetical protein GGR57DRAFT_445678 [Xylariaceae sp. FL1272]
MCFFSARLPPKMEDTVRAAEHCQKRHTKLWISLVISDELLQSPVANEISALLQLPHEVLLMVFQYTCPLTKICLAVTCKHLLHVSRLTTIKTPSANKHRQLAHDSPLYAPHSEKCSAMRLLLHLMHPLDRNKQRTKTLAVCAFCCSYRPTNKAYWTFFRRFEHPRRGWTRKESTAFISCWVEQSTNSCPQCTRERKR